MKNIAILISGSGTNMQRISEAIDAGEIQNARITQVIADRDCYGIERAKNLGLPLSLVKKGKDFSSRLHRELHEDTDLVVLAGFLSFLNEEFCEQWKYKVINIHPSLLPKYGGKGMWGHHVHQAVREANDSKTGASVHFVTAGIDEGAVILQKEVSISNEDSVEDIAAKVHEIEYEIVPKAIQKLLNDQ